MSQEFIAKIRVIPPPGLENEVAGQRPQDLSNEDLNRIADVVNRAVATLQQKLQATAQSGESGNLSLSELQLTFGIDLEGETKIPIIGPLLQVGFKAGATFQIQIKLER